MASSTITILRRAWDLLLVIAVQSFMLVQCGVFYFRNRLRTKKSRSLVGVPSSEELLGPITVVVPVLNEAKSIEKTLRRLADAAADPQKLEVIVSDSGCTDKTMDIVELLASSGTFPATLRTTVAGGGGRGGAICAGLEASDAAYIGSGPRGAILLFLHADTILPPRFDIQLRAAFSRPGVLMTAFRFQTDRADLPPGTELPAGMALMEFTVNVRSSVYELPFGDQSLAVTRANLDMVGGFPELPILEEYELVQKFRKLSAEGAGRVVLLQDVAMCSPRRWLQRPIWKVNWVNQMMMIRYNHFGTTVDDLFRFYYQREPPAPRRRRAAAK